MGLLLGLALLGTAGNSFAQEISNLKYPSDPASVAHPGVARGQVLNFEFHRSKIFPGTRRTYSVYIPAGYDPAKPACLFICLDGILFNAPTVFDNLIAKGDMPVTIGVFIGAGAVMKNDTELVRYNRSNEFDNTNGDFVRFILDELLPEIATKKTPEGKDIRISEKAADRCIAGASSGAICAFTAAWQRPDVFSRVFSAIGTFVGMRGGDQYPELIRKTEPKPIRIFLQDGLKDAWNPLFGNWYTSNLSMEAALNFAGYEVNHAWGEGGHDGIQAQAIFPDVMRWLWKGWPEPVTAGPSANNLLSTILSPKKPWMPASEWPGLKGNMETDGHPETRGGILLIDSSGDLVRLDTMGHRSLLVKMDKAKKTAAGPEGNIYVLERTKNAISIYGPDGSLKKSIRKISGEGMLVTDKGNIYVSQQGTNRADPGKLWLIRSDGSRQVVGTDENMGSALAIYPDKRMLVVSERHSHWIISYTIGDDGALSDRQRLYWLHNMENFDHEQTAGMVFDKKGNLYVATTMGVQICDQNGRVRGILTLPGGPVSAICFGGANLDILYVACGNRLYKRKLNTNGAPAWMPPLTPPSIGAG